MEKLHAFAMHVWLGMPVWCWGLCAFLIGLDELLVMFGKKSRALSVFRSAFRLLLSVPLLSSVLVRLPLLGSVLKACAGIEPISTAEADALKAASGAVGGQKGSALLSVVLALAAVGLIGGAALLAGCGHSGPYWTAFGACMEGKGISAGSAVGQEAINDLSTGTNAQVIESQLEALAGRAGTDAVDCAVSAWMASGKTAALNPAGVEAAKLWRKAHAVGGAL